MIVMKVVVSLLPVVMAMETMITSPTGQCTAKLYPGHGTMASKYKSLRASNASACCLLCQLDDRCGHFVYETQGEKPCHLKQGNNMTLNVKSGCTAGAPDKPAPKPAPTPPPIPPEPPVLGYKPHLIFFLGDDGANP